MKHMKKLAALLLALVMALALAVPAMAAEDVEVEPSGREYKIAQIFTGDQMEGSDVLGNIEWSPWLLEDDDGNIKLLTVLKTNSRFLVDGKNIFADCTTAAQVAAVLAQYGDNSEIARSFAAVAVVYNCIQYMNYKNENGRWVDVRIYGDTTSIELDPGYYVIVDSKIIVDGKPANCAVLQVTKKGKLTVAYKSDIPVVEKFVKDIDGNWDKAASWSIGDDVSFRLVGTLPQNYFDYENYGTEFEDVLSRAFQYNENSVKVYVVNGDSRVDVTDSFTVKTEDYRVFTLRIRCENLKKIPNVTITENSTIVAEYTAKLQSTANLGSTGNKNEVKLGYSWDPVQIGTAYLPYYTNTDTVMVFTNEFDITKVDGADSTKKLEGAEFKLEKDGKYVIVDSDNKVTGWADTQADGSTLTSDADGLVKIIGLGEGTYQLHEIKAPAGYNVLTAPIEVVITDVAGTDTETSLPKLDSLTIALDGGDAQNGDVATGLVTATVENNTGASLPETGGVGTTLFYIIGGMLMVGAAVLLVTRKRMSDAK